MSRNVFAPSLSVPLACVVLALVSAGCGSSPPPPDLLVTAAPGIQTNEGGAQATFTVQLSSRPRRDVVLSVSSSDTSEATVTTASLVFTRDNWNAPQTVLITGVDDDLADGTQTVQIDLGPSTSGDARFVGLSATVSLDNVDDETAGITVSQPLGSVGEDGSTTTFTVVLHSQPTASVEVSLASSDEGEGTLDSQTLTFTAMNWNAPQTVTVSGVDDDLIDGTQTFDVSVTAITSADGDYDSLALPSAVQVDNIDDDSAGIAVVSIDDESDEEGASASFTLALRARPSADVSITLSSSREDEGVIVSSTTLTFTADDYDVPQTVTVEGQDDDLADGNQPYVITISVAASDDTDYAALADVDVALSNLDDDSAAILVSDASGHTAEDGTQATFTVRLASQPYADVTIEFDTSDAGEGQVDLTSLVFGAADWDQEQTVTITGQDDDVDDGDQPYTIAFSDVSSSDAAYDVLMPANVVVTNDDDDDTGVVVSLISGNTTEALGSATFTVVLLSEPTADVVLGFASNDPTEGETDVAELTFTSDNWDLPQTVTVTGVDDDIVDGDVAYQVVFDAIVSADLTYMGIVPDSVDVTNEDDREICSCSYAGDDFEDGMAQGFTSTGGTFAVNTTMGANGTAQSLEVTGGGNHLVGVSLSAPACEVTRFSAWVRPSAGSEAHNYIVLGDDAVSATNAILFFYAHGSTGSWRIFSSTGINTPYTVGVWSHLVVDVDWSTDTIDVSIDGVSIATDFPFRGTTIDTLTRVHLYNLTAAGVGQYDELEFETSCP